jgi:glycosyltransferase involved in cell wall biosynthesis
MTPAPPIRSDKCRRVLILQESIESYRTKFYELLDRRLRDHGVELTIGIDWGGGKTAAQPFDVYEMRWIGRGKLRWTFIPPDSVQFDLVVFPQQVRNLAYLWCQQRRKVRHQRNAFWGHGRCFDPKFEQRLSEKAKRWFSLRVDWWFAYNDLSARIVNQLGFPLERITSVMNSTDTTSLRRRLMEVQADGLDVWRQRLGIGPGPVGVFTGRLYINKRVEFTIAAAKEIRKRIPSFEMIFIGNGEDRDMVETAVAEHPWIHYPGALNNNDKVPYWALADVLLNPGVVGLVINDAMALGLPTITTNFPTHSPEIDYLHDGINGIITSPWEDVQRFAEASVELLQNPSRLEAMKAAAFESGNRFSAEIMASNFASGIVSALNTST